ncbi:MAG: DUF4167 domain-containing protein [Rhizobiales bacterium]|nr:DUF4167 domain-containing protein [Hyphomicrobiales bacterium]
MRTNQSKRMRGRNRKSQNPLTRVYESNGPDVKIRGSASHVAEKYVQLARDAQASGDPVAAENYYQHAEHYFRLIAGAQEQYRQNQPFYRPEGGEGRSDDIYDDGDDDGMAAMGGEPSYGSRETQPYPSREPQPYMPREAQPHYARQQQPGAAPGTDAANDVERLPSFITGGGPQPQQGNGQNGHEGGQQQAERYPLHRRRRRHRGPRGDAPSAPGSDDAHQPGD